MLKVGLSLLLIMIMSTHIMSKENTPMAPIYDFKVKTISGEETTLAPYKDQVMLIVNVASKCGYTSQYAGLQALYEKYKAQGFVVLGFPCNQFANQEPGSEAEIQNFCQVNFGVNFPMFAKIDVNGDQTAPLYRYLKTEQKGILGTEAIKWNFTKFLVDRHGKVVARYGSSTTPKELEAAIETLLKH
jgi:glutathione peroxidase